MSNSDPGEGLAARQRASRQQCAGAVLMIRPASFDYNPETAATNSMQQHGSGGAEAALEACREFDRFVQALSSEGVSVCVAADTPDPPKPDAVFPNNWVSFHE
ncbi:MAG TPA: arginine deiminase-related protein, partial [Steroidobacteraceae bacterium]|nr:arginine deiminase-related protein [Steroidobacteraceae bacterium]